MSIFERVHELIKEQGLNVKQLERECGLANATIRRWETQTPNIESVRKVAHRLNVTIDYLVNGGSPNAPAAPSCDGVPLSSMEADLVAMFRLLPEEAKKEIFDALQIHAPRRRGKRVYLLDIFRRERRRKKRPRREP